MTRMRNVLRALFRHDAMNAEMNDEMRAHLARATERLVARGLSPREADVQARREFGNVAVIGEDARDARGAPWVESLRGDVRHGLRSLRASPAFTIVAVLSLAIGIGANTAIFSLVNAVMLRALPVAHPEQLVALSVMDSVARSGSTGMPYWTNPLWETIRDQAQGEADFAVSGDNEFNLTTGGEIRRASSMWVNGAFFQTLGVRPIAGRLIAPADDYRGCPGTVVASEGFWQSELGGDPTAIGRSVVLDGKPYTLLGVVPREFYGVTVGTTTQLYVPLCAEPIMQGERSALAERSSWWLRIFARPKPGISRERFAARMQQISHGAFEANASPHFDAARLAEFVTRKIGVLPGVKGLSELRSQYSKALLVLMGMVGVVLLISCANVANLMLARGAARGREMAIRVAIGASRWRLIRQSLTEAFLLSVLGTVLGVLLATWASRLLVAMLNDRNPVVLDLTMDIRVMSFSAALCVATVLLFGLGPAWRSTNVDPQSAMKSGGRGGSDGIGRFRVGKALVVAQSALALTLVVGAGLLVSTFRHLTTADIGFEPAGVLIARLEFGSAGIPAAQRGEYIQRIRQQVAMIPGVTNVSASEVTPVGGSYWNDQIAIEGAAKPAKERDQIAWFNKVDSGYFAAMGTRLLAGRDFGSLDTPNTQKVGIMNEAAAKHFFGSQSPLGKVYYTESMGHRGERTTIVGVVENTRYQTMRDDTARIVYTTYLQDPASEAGGSQLIVRAASVPAAISGIKSIAASANRGISLSFRRLSDQVDQSLRRERLLAVLSGFFGVLAVVLAMIGLYGVLAYTVARRRVEIGIRIALGAARGRVLRLILGDVGRLVGAGIVIGAAASLAATKVLGSLLYGVQPRDTRTLVAAAVLLAAAAIIAGAIPARRAAALQPVEALRED